MTVTEETKVLFKFRGVSVTRCREGRIKREERLEGRNYYDMRHPDNDMSEPYSLEKGIMVNFFGTLETTSQIAELETGEPYTWLELTEEEIDTIIENRE